MLNLTYFTPQPVATEIPSQFPSPFTGDPHPLAQRASEEVQKTLLSGALSSYDFSADDGGKMIGVLVVSDHQQRIGYLVAYSGMLAGSWTTPGFVPPIFDEIQHHCILTTGGRKLGDITGQINTLIEAEVWGQLKEELKDLTQQYNLGLGQLQDHYAVRRARRRRERQAIPISGSEKIRQPLLHHLSMQSQADKLGRRKFKQYWAEKIAVIQGKIDEYEAELGVLKKNRARLSRKFQRHIFNLYRLSNSTGQQRSVLSFFDNELPPGGTGDCAAPKLIQFANCNGFKPLALAEFWWGAAPADGVRHHRQYYPACRGKCHSILPFMLGNMELESLTIRSSSVDNNLQRIILYEDDFILVINKPEGLLSVPGKHYKDSVQIRVQDHYPGLTGPLMVHRLDMATSGILLVAKNAAIHKALQRQFINRTITKRYVAILDTGPGNIDASSGDINLPLRTDYDDRPRQLVCYKYGKPAITRWQLIASKKDRARVYFYPLTGRTHQLRLHAAHRDGLNAPIVGDELYGRSGARLMLHAEYLEFFHPVLKEQMTITTPVPF